MLCTANQCRSPMAEALLRARLRAAGVDAVVSSAGDLTGGVPASPGSVTAMAARGHDLGGHVSRTLDTVEPGAADLVLTMERRHLQEAILLDAALRTRAFTLRDAVARAEAAEPRRPDEDLRDWAARLASGRTPAEIIGIGDDAVADPIGGSRRRYEQTADLLGDLLSRLVDQAFPHAAQDVA